MIRIRKFNSRAVASEAGGGGVAASPWTRWARQVKSVDGFASFRLSYFDYSELQLFAVSYSRSISRRHISLQMLKIAFWSLQI